MHISFICTLHVIAMEVCIYPYNHCTTSTNLLLWITFRRTWVHFGILGYISAVSNVYNNNKGSLLFIFFYIYLIFHPRDNYSYYRERLEFKYYSLVTVCLCKPSSLKATVEHLSHRGFRCGRFKT